MRSGASRISVLARVLIVVLTCVLVTVPARASVQDVIQDYDANNTVISRCHDLEDYIIAKRVAPGQGYGDALGAIDDALAQPSLVGTPEHPCPATAVPEGSDGGGWGGRSLVVVIVLQVLILGVVLWIVRDGVRRGLARLRRAAGTVPPRVAVPVVTVVAIGAVVLTVLGLRGPPQPTVEVLDMTVHAPVAALQDDRLVSETPRPPAFIRTRMTTMRALGARAIRVDLRWDLVARSRPAMPTDPGDPAYDWTTYDRIVAEAARAGLKVSFTVWGTPDWAADPGVAAVPSDPAWGNRRPADAAWFGEFAQAVVSRYAPRGVTDWEVWNEPNIDMFLRPQYERQGTEWVAVGPRTYAALLSAFTRGARAAAPDVRIVSGGVAPVGDSCDIRCSTADVGESPHRLGPAQFLRALAALPEAADVEVVAAHPYPSGPPPAAGAPRRTRRIDMDNLADLVTTLEATTFRDRPIWLTEYGWQTTRSQALRYTVTPDEQAARVSQTFGLLTGFPTIRRATYYLLQDNGAFNSGLYSAAADDALSAPKPAADAFALPLARIADGPDGRARLVGQVRPSRGATTAVLERRTGDGWATLSSFRTRADGTFAVAVDTHGARATLRVRWDDGSGSERAGVPLSVS